MKRPVQRFPTRSLARLLKDVTKEPQPTRDKRIHAQRLELCGVVVLTAPGKGPYFVKQGHVYFKQKSLRKEEHILYMTFASRRIATAVCAALNHCIRHAPDPEDDN